MSDPERDSRWWRSSRLTAVLDGSLAGSGAASLALKILAAVLGLITNVVLARLLRVDEFGRYAIALSWLNVLTIGAVLGWNGVVLREIPVLYQRGDRAAIAALLRASIRDVVGAGILVGCIFLMIYWLIASKITMLFVIAAAALPLLALRTVYQSAVQGLGRVAIAQVPDLLLRPVGYLALITCAGVVMKGRVTAATAMVLYAATLMLVVIVTRSLIGSTHGSVVLQNTAVRSWRRQSLQLFVYSALATLNSYIDVLIVGASCGAESTAVFNVAANCAAIISFPLLAFNAALAPRVARLHAEGDAAAIQRAVTRSTMMATILATPITLTLLLAGSPILRIFGPNYVAGYASMAILSIGQWVNVATGSVGLLLVMTGYELLAARFLGGVLVLKCIGMIVGARLVGIEGAAAVSACAVMTWNLLLHNAVLKKLNIRARLWIWRDDRE